MRPLQDQCLPSSYEALDAMVLHDTGKSIDELFIEFNPNPIGVASLAQVHVGRDRETGKKVAIKLQVNPHKKLRYGQLTVQLQQHPHLEEFAEIEYVVASRRVD